MFYLFVHPVHENGTKEGLMPETTAVQKSAAKTGQRVWICIDCNFAQAGTHEDAYKAHYTSGETWRHWVYEFIFINGFHYEPTGREIHTSDLGGYYLNRTFSQIEVYRLFALRRTDPVLAKHGLKPALY